MTDVRLALRHLARSPSYSLVAVLTLALGIGATTAIYSVVNGVLLRPLPYRAPERLIAIWETHPSFARMSVSYLDYLDWAARTQSLSDIGRCARRVIVMRDGGILTDTLQTPIRAKPSAFTPSPELVA